MAEQPTESQFTAVESREILEDRQRGWQRFTQFATWAIVIVAAVLIGLALFVA